MSNEEQIALPLPSDLLKRADRLAAVLAELPEYQITRTTRSAVLRLALVRGLAALEGEHGRTSGREARRTQRRGRRGR